MGRIIAGLLALVMWIVLLDFASTSITNSPVDTEVMVGHSTYLNCSTSDPSREVHWYLHPVGTETKDHKYVYAHGRMHPPFDKRFRIDKDNSPGSFDLVLTDVEYGDAGLYVCQNGGGTGQLISAQLIVLDTPPSCETNIKSEGFIGPNSCDLETDKVQLSCGVNYHGNIPPALEWTMAGQKTRASSSEPSCQVSDTRVTCNVTLDTDINMDGSSFVCQTTRAVQGQYRCITDKAKVLYAVGDKKPLEKTIGDDVTCSAKTNSPSCSYNWIWFDGVSENTISNDQNLEVKELGWHRCEANCKIKEHPCNIVPMLVKGSAAQVPVTGNDQTIGIIIAVVVTFVLCLIIAAIPGYFMWRKLNGETLSLRSSVEELREKDSQWKEEKNEIREQLRQVEELTGTILEVQAENQNQTAEKDMKRSLEKLQNMITKFLREIPGPPVYRGESLHSKYGFNGFNGSISNGKKKSEKETFSVRNDDDSKMPFISESIEGKKLRKEIPSMENNHHENNSPLCFNDYKYTGGQDRTPDVLCETHKNTLKTQDSLASKLKGFGRNGQ